MKISVIIPCYKAEKYLRDCLDSVVAQDFTDWEAICIDNASPDGCGKILDEYAARDCRFRVVHRTTNIGVWAARNDGLGLATGEWITFIDSDDIVARHWFSRAMQMAGRDRPDLIVMGYCFAKNLPVGFGVDAHDVANLLTGVEATRWAWSELLLKGFLWRTFSRREIVGDLRFLPRINCKEDSIWLAGLIPSFNRIAVLRFAGYFYRFTPGSGIRRNRNVSQCVAYLDALKSLWNRNQQGADEGGYLDVVRANIRAAADNDVVEWVMMRASEDDAPQKKVVEAYGELKSAGAFEGTKYTHRWRYWLGFIWWRLTGQVWMMRIPGVFFLYLRMLLNRLKL